LLDDVDFDVDVVADDVSEDVAVEVALADAEDVGVAVELLDAEAVDVDVAVGELEVSSVISWVLMKVSSVTMYRLVIVFLGGSIDAIFDIVHLTGRSAVAVAM